MFKICFHKLNLECVFCHFYLFLNLFVLKAREKKSPSAVRQKKKNSCIKALKANPNILCIVAFQVDLVSGTSRYLKWKITQKYLRKSSAI